RDLAVGDFMATTIDTVSLDDTLIKVAALCVERRRKTVPVVDAENRFVGMITRRALLEHVVAASRDAT
ncbi:MAG: CBS domain-containing protein, partial [Acidobacteriota bacterium]